METSERGERGAGRTENGTGDDLTGTVMPGKDAAINRQMPGAGENIYDLQDVVPEGNGKGNQEVIVIDGRVYERVRKPDDKIYDLDDIIEKGSRNAVAVGGGWNEEAARLVAQTAEKIAREMVPAIAERVIREEIEKLKRDHGMGTG